MGRAIFAVFLLLITLVGSARSTDPTTLFPQLLESQSGAHVIVDFVLNFDAGGSPQRIQGSVDGVVISADGLVLLAAAVLNPTDLFRQISGEGSSMPNNMRSNEFRVRMPGRGEPLRATVVTQDTDAGIAWIKLGNPPKDLRFVDLRRAREPKIGEPAYSIGLVGENNAFAPFIEENRVMGRVEVPFPGYIVAPAARILFGSDGRPLGYGVIRYAGMPNMAAMGAFKSFAVMVPGPRLQELTLRARTQIK